MDIIIAAGAYAAFVAALVIVLDWRFPSAARRNLILASALPVPVAIALTGIGWAVLLAGRPMPGSGVAATSFVAVAAVAALASLVTLVAGAAIALLVTLRLRPRPASPPA